MLRFHEYVLVLIVVGVVLFMMTGCGAQPIKPEIEKPCHFTPLTLQALPPLDLSKYKLERDQIKISPDGKTATFPTSQVFNDLELHIIMQQRIQLLDSRIADLINYQNKNAC